MKGLEIWVQLWSCILWRVHLLSFHLISSIFFPNLEPCKLLKMMNQTILWQMFFCYFSLMLKGLEIWVQLWSCILWRVHLLSFHLIISKLFLRRNFENIFVLASFSSFYFPTFSSTYLKSSVRLSKIFQFLQVYNYTIHQSQYVPIRVYTA